MNKLIDIYRDPIWDLMDWFNRPAKDKLSTSGLRASITRPHNLINVKDENGKVIAQRLEIVTTPFKSSDVRVSVTDNTLSVQCGSENISDAENEEVAYRGISSQSYSFAITLAPSVDQTKISAENRDGVLKINIPLIQEEKKKPETIEIAVN